MKRITKLFVFLLFYSSFLWAQSISLISPINGITGQPIIPNFHWDATGFSATETGTYVVRISTDGSNQTEFTNHTFFTWYTSPMIGNLGYETAYNEATKNQAAPNDGSYQFPLANNALYYWQVTFYPTSGSPAPTPSAIYHFTTFFAGSPIVSLFNPANAQTNISNNLSFSWGSSVGNASYKLQWIMSNSTPTPAQWLTANEYNTMNKQHNITLGGGTKYYWRVAITNTTFTKYYAFSNVYSFATSGGAVVPTANYPNGVDADHPTILYRNDPTFNWYLDGSSNYLTYNIRIFTHINGISNLVFSKDNISSMSYYHNANLDPNTLYCWWVQSVYNDGINAPQASAFSDVKYFRTQGSGTVYKPTLTYPINGNLIYTSTPYLNWCLSSGSTGLSFRGQYRQTNANFDSDPGNNVSFGPTAQYIYQVISPLSASKIYFWRVRSLNSSGSESDWSDVQSFQIIGGQLTNVVPNYPKDNDVVYNVKPTLTWYLDGNSLGIEGYIINIWKAGVNIQTSPLIPAGSTSFTLTTALEAGTAYQWHIATKIGSTLKWSDKVSFQVYGSQFAGIPVPNYPKDETIFSNSVTISWFISGSLANIQGYELKYSYSDVFDPDPAVTQTVTTTTQSFYVNNLVPGAIYYWKVRSWYGGTNYSDYSAVKYFMVYPGSSPMQPLVGGPNNMALTVVNPNLSWITPLQSTSPLKYQVEVADNPTFTNATVVNNIQQNSQVMNNLAQNKQYYWRVKSQIPSGTYSNYSNTGRFSLGDVPNDAKDDIKLPNTFSLSQNFPNPFNPSTVINYSTPIASHISIVIYDVLGRAIETLVNEQKEAGKYSIDFNATKYSSGIYYYELRAGDFRSFKKMMLIK